MYQNKPSATQIFDITENTIVLMNDYTQQKQHVSKSDAS